MTPLPADISPKDVNQWLSEGWFYADIKGVPTICRLYGTAPDMPDTAVVSTLRDTDGESKEHKVKFDKLSAYWPICGALNIMPDQSAGMEGKIALSLTRLQKKQWKRTYNAYCLRARAISDRPKDLSINPDYACVVRAAFNPEYYSYTEAFRRMFPDGWKSVAINPNLIVQKIDDTKQLVYVEGEVVGSIDNFRFTCINPGLKRRLLSQFDYMVE